MCVCVCVLEAVGCTVMCVFFEIFYFMLCTDIVKGDDIKNVEVTSSD